MLDRFIVKRSTGLRDVLFRLSAVDDQLLLAVALCLTDLQTELRGSDEHVSGILSAELWDWLEERTGTKRGHPNIDHVWESKRAVQASLRRLQQRGLLRATPAYYSGALVWRPTPAAGDYLRETQLFADEPDRLAG